MENHQIQERAGALIDSQLASPLLDHTMAYQSHIQPLSSTSSNKYTWSWQGVL